MPVPDFQSLMQPVLRAAADGEITVAECVEKIAPQLGLSSEDLGEMLPSGRQTVINNRIHWAKFYMTKAGLVRMVRRGLFTASEKGRQLLTTSPERIDKSVLAQYPEYVEWWEKSRAGGNDPETATLPSAEHADTATPEERIEASHALLTNTLRAELLERLVETTPSFFEQVIVDLLVAMGYGGGRAEMGKAIGKSGDRGIDGIVKEDPLGLDIVYIQAKRYQPHITIGRPDLQAFAGSMEGFGATKGVFVTTSSFAASARDFAGRISKRIILIDGEELTRLMVKHNVGVRSRATYEVKRIDEDYFVEE